MGPHPGLSEVRKAAEYDSRLSRPEEECCRLRQACGECGEHHAAAQLRARRWDSALVRFHSFIAHRLAAHRHTGTSLSALYARRSPSTVGGSVPGIMSERKFARKKK